MEDEEGLLTDQANDLLDDEEVISMVQQPKPRKTAPSKPQYN